MAKNYRGIGIALKKLNKREDAVESVEKGLKVLLELEKETGYHYPLIVILKNLRNLCRMEVRR